MTRTVLVLGTNPGQADLIRHLNSRGWRTIGASRSAGEVGAALCDRFEQVDIVDLDALEAVARRHGVNLVYSISSDVAIRSATVLAERMDLPHFYDTAFIDLLDDKAALRHFLDERALGVVPFSLLAAPDDAAGWNLFPCVVKPIDAQGQRGVQRVWRPEDLPRAIEAAVALSRSGRAVVEAFLDGIEMSCNVLVCGGLIRLKILSERLVHAGTRFGLPLGHLVPPVRVATEEMAAADRLVERIVEAFGYRDGVLYFQMIVTRDGPRIVEIAPRLDGCHMWRLIEAAHGVNLIEMAVDCLSGETSSETALARPTESGHALMFQQMPPGKPFWKADFPVPEGALYHEYRYEEGQTVTPTNGRLEVVGYYVCKTS